MKQREIYHPIPPNLPLVLPFFAIFCPYTTIFAHIPPYVPILTKVKGNPLILKIWGGAIETRHDAKPSWPKRVTPPQEPVMTQNRHDANKWHHSVGLAKFGTTVPPYSQNPRILGQKYIWNKESGTTRYHQICPRFCPFSLFFAHVPPYLPMYHPMCPFSPKSRATL